MNNLGGLHAGAITAALFLEDSSVTARGPTSTSPAPPGATPPPRGPRGMHRVGARLLIELALDFTPTTGAGTAA